MIPDYPDFPDPGVDSVDDDGDGEDMDSKKAFNFDIPRNHRGIKIRLMQTIHCIETKMFIEQEYDDDDDDDDSFCLDDLDNKELMNKTFEKIPKFLPFEEFEEGVEVEDTEESIEEKNVSDSRSKLGSCIKNIRYLDVDELLSCDNKTDQLLKCDILPVGAEKENWYSVPSKDSFLKNIFNNSTKTNGNKTKKSHCNESKEKTELLPYQKAIPLSLKKNDTKMTVRKSSTSVPFNNVPKIKVDSLILKSQKLLNEQKSRSLFEDVNKIGS